MSISGLYIRLPRSHLSHPKLDVGQRLRARFFLPEEARPIDTEAEVIRLVPEDKGFRGRPVLGVGLSLVEPSPGTVALLNAFVQESRFKVLVLDDEPDILRLIEQALRSDFHVLTSSEPEKAFDIIREHELAVIVADQQMPVMTGAQFFQSIADKIPGTRSKSIIMSAYPEVEEIQKLINQGHVFNFLGKPFRMRELVRAVRRAIDAYVMEVEDERINAELERSNRQLRRENAELRHKVGMHTFVPIVGNSDAMREIVTTVEQVASTNATVLIRGETGTGKELIARAVHGLSQRCDLPFVAFNCAALPENLIESELFGHERGAFTGARERRVGRFERAHGGTIFIDEVGDLPPSVQVKLLRVLQENAIERIGSNESKAIDIRVVAATHRDLDQMIEEGLFREDLFYRLNVVPIHLPPLRERPDDIWALVAHYLDKMQRQMGKEGIRISQQTRKTMEAHPWPGNVRELVNVIERMVALTPSHGVVEMAQIRVRAPRRSWTESPPEEFQGKLKDIMGKVEKRVIVGALKRCEGNRTRAAKDLGISRQSLLQKISKYQLA